MSVQAKWMRAEMLGSPRPSERQLTEAELRVQRSLQKLSIPEWYLNKRTDPPKILTNVTPIESRPPSWKNGTFKKKPTEYSSSKNPTGTYKVGKNGNEIPNKQNQAVSTHKGFKKEKNEPENRKSNSPKDEAFDINKPNKKYAGNISKTFPKVSPSRKVQNINIVLPQKKEKTPGLPSEEPTDSKYRTFIKRSCASPKSRETESSDEDVESLQSTLTRKNVSRTNTSRDASFTTSHCLTSTIEKSDEELKSPNTTLTERTESSSGKYSVSIMSNWSRNNARICEDISLESRQSMCCCLTPTKNRSEVESDSSCADNSLKASNLKTIFTIPAASTPIRNSVSIFSSTMIDDTPIRRQSIFPRFLAEEIEAKNEELLVEQTPTRRQSVVCARLIKPDITAAKPKPVQRMRKHSDPAKDLGLEPSPNTRFFHSRKKSTELENIVKTSMSNNTGTVKRMIQELNRRLEPTPNPASRKCVGNQQTFVKNLVLALENGCKQTAQQILATKRRTAREEDIDSAGSCSESAVSSTTISIKDSDSDSDQISPRPTAQNEEFFRFDQSSKSKDTSGCEDESVYWIPVPRCKLPRTSSLLSMMSRLSGQYQSPCVSPIKGGDNCKSCYGDTWGSGKVAGNMARPLFRIDETTVMDSGFSDRSDGSDRSGASSSEFSRSSSLNVSGRSQRRKSIVDQRVFER